MFSPLVSGLLLATRPVNIIKTAGGSSQLSQIVKAFKYVAYSVIAFIAIFIVMAYDLPDRRPEWAREAY